jgi:molecular chaperone GrpE
MSEEQEPKPEAEPEARIAELELEIAQMKDAMLRALAEAENTRRRAEKSSEDSRLYAIDRFARDLLAVADNLGRALSSVTPEQRADPALAQVLEGVALTETALLETFTRYGLRRIGAKGDKFDPNLHQAVAQIPSDAPAGAIADVFQPGYVLADRTLRAAMVAVSLGAAPAATETIVGTGENLDVKV